VAEPGLAQPTGRRQRRRDRRQRGSRWPRVLLVIGIVLVVLSGGTLITPKLLYGRWTSNITPAPPPPPHPAQPGKGGIKGPINLLLLGVDDREDNPEGGSRSDSIIIVHINAAHDHAYLVSIPRDARVEYPPFPAADYKGGEMGKINGAYEIGTRNGLG